MKSTNNLELKELARLDQLDRTKYNFGELSLVALHQQDYQRLLRVYQLLEENKVITVDDHLNAAIVLHHGRDEENERDTKATELAVKTLKTAHKMDPAANKWLLAAAIDRDLMIRNKLQIYGTQFTRKSETAPWEFYSIDPSQISDEERKEHRVPVLAEQQSELIRMNRKTLSGIYSKSKNIEAILTFCKENFKRKTEYDTSWRGISKFGCQLLRLDKDGEALKVFQLLIKLYPEEYDPYHTLGVLLVKLKREEEAINAFEKSLEINPSFGDAQKDLDKLRNKIS